MATQNKVTRRTEAEVRDRGKLRKVVVTILPQAGTLGLRLHGLRETEHIDIALVYQIAMERRAGAGLTIKQKKSNL